MQSWKVISQLRVQLMFIGLLHVSGFSIRIWVGGKILAVGGEWNTLACEQAHLVCYSREYLGGGSWAGEKNGASKSEPARKPLNFEFSAFVHERSIVIGLKWQAVTDFIIVTSGVIVCGLFFRLLDCEQSLSSPNFSDKEYRTTARSLSVFQSIQFLNVTRF